MITNKPTTRLSLIDEQLLARETTEELVSIREMLARRSEILANRISSYSNCFRDPEDYQRDADKWLAESRDCHRDLVMVERILNERGFDGFGKAKDSKTRFTKLESVGSAISNFGFIYPLNADGSVDAACQIDVADASDEWLASLSKGDAAIVIKMGACPGTPEEKATKCT